MKSAITDSERAIIMQAEWRRRRDPKPLMPFPDAESWQSARFKYFVANYFINDVSQWCGSGIAERFFVDRIFEVSSNFEDAATAYEQNQGACVTLIILGVSRQPFLYRFIDGIWEAVASRPKPHP